MEATIADLSFAPSKSMRAYEEVRTLTLSHRGVEGDRLYMLVEDPEPDTPDVVPGQFLSQRKDPLLTQIVPTLTPKGLSLSWQDRNPLLVSRREDTDKTRIPVCVWGWSGEGVDQGREPAVWASTYLHRPVRLVAVSDLRPRYVEGDSRFGRVGFADGYPLTVGSTTAFAAINRYLKGRDQPEMPNDRTRTTLVLDGLTPPVETDFPEDYIDSITVTSGGMTAILRQRKACGRCKVPDIDKKTGESQGRLGAALGKLGRFGLHADQERYGAGSEVFLTQNFIVEWPDCMPPDATVRLDRGATVDVSYKSTTNWVPRTRSS